MTAHTTRIEDSYQGDLPYRWICSCGDRSKHRFGYYGHAQSAGHTHERGKAAPAPRTR